MLDLSVSVSAEAAPPSVHYLDGVLEGARSNKA